MKFIMLSEVKNGFLVKTTTLYNSNAGEYDNMLVFRTPKEFVDWALEYLEKEDPKKEEITEVKYHT